MIKKGWEVIKRYPYYMISADGEIYSIKRRNMLKQSSSAQTKIPKVTLRCQIGKKTYSATETVARLVAETFIGLPDGNIEDYVVYHKDGNSENNRVNNLCWCLRKKCPSLGRKGRSIIATNSSTGETLEFDSVRIAAGALCGCTSGIYACLSDNNKYNKYKGYTFKYKEE